jgi:hypothetical protein
MQNVRTQYTTLLPEEMFVHFTNSYSFVCAVSAANVRMPTLFRTYEVPRFPGPKCKIWKAALATSAAPTFFKPIEIGKLNVKVAYFDAAIGHSFFSGKQKQLRIMLTLSVWSA